MIPCRLTELGINAIDSEVVLSRLQQLVHRHRKGSD
jgi:hypothetical protein